MGLNHQNFSLLGDNATPPLGLPTNAKIAASDWSAAEETLYNVAGKLQSDCTVLRRKTNGAADILVRRQATPKDFIEIRVAVVGNVDAGKSTLLGVLTHGELDNGRGQARLKLFRHKHEIESGRTSSVGNDILGFDSKGNIVNKPDAHDGHLDWAQICEDSSKEHLGLALALNVPVFVVVTKIDMCPANVLEETMKVLIKLLKSPGCRKLHILVQNVDHVIVCAQNFMSERICPIFRVSNVTGENMQLLKMFLNLLSVRFKRGDPSEPAEFQIDDTYAVPGVGTVVSGTCTKGVIRLNDQLQLGPDGGGRFISVPIKSIHRKRLPVVQVAGGQTASFSLKKIKRSSIRKGMVLISPLLEATGCWEFEADVLVLHHPTTISPKYQAMVHCGGVRQTATILSMTRDCLRTGDKAAVKFRFIKAPEYLHIGQKLVFREGRTKAIGNITKVVPYAAQQAASEPLNEELVEAAAVDVRRAYKNSKRQRHYNHQYEKSEKSIVDIGQETR
uniref:GTP-binding protein 1 n=1 Tax=Romanomermis culicivorax TaxID=13658 RepID=A0A915L0X3_ROMCU